MTRKYIHKVEIILDGDKLSFRLFKQQFRSDFNSCFNANNQLKILAVLAVSVFDVSFSIALDSYRISAC